MAFLLPHVLLASSYMCAVNALVPTVRFARHSSSFDWSTLTSDTELYYQSCYDNKFECARLTVPLDWRDEKNPNNVSLPIIRLPATVALSDPKHAGTIIVNPGGESS